MKDSELSLECLTIIHSEENFFQVFTTALKMYMPEFKKDFNVTRRSIPNKI